MSNSYLEWALDVGRGRSQCEIVVVIVNPKNPAANLTSEQVAAIFLGTTTTFPDGGAVALADQPEAAGIRGDFYQKATGRSAAQVKATWARLTFPARARRRRN